MSEYWVSKKKYFCKYCDTYIADDAPSRQHHENGLRHKGNLERYIRGIYKAGEKKKKDLEEEKREMARVEQAANAAYAQDISLGHAKPSTSSLPAASSTASRKPASKPSNPFANYTTAAQLGFEDPDIERLEVRKTQGVIGEWEAITPTTTTTTQSTSPVPESDVKPEVGADGNVIPNTEALGKRPAEEAPSDDTRTFKLRKKTVAAGLGEIYDPGLIPIKLKKKEEDTSSIIPPDSSSTSTTSQRPKWTAISLKPQEGSTNATTNSGESSTAFSNASNISESMEGSGDKAAKGWAKVNWGQHIQEDEAVVSPPVDSSSMFTKPLVKTEQNEPLPEATSISTDSSTTGLFKKRKVGARGGRTRGIDG